MRDLTELYDVKEKLCRELKSYGKKETLDLTTLQAIDTLAHALKNVCKVIECYEDEEENYSYAPMPHMPRMSFGRGRGPYAKRDSMGRYSSRDGGYAPDGDFKMELQELMNSAPNDFVRQKMMEAMNGM